MLKLSKSATEEQKKKQMYESFSKNRMKEKGDILQKFTNRLMLSGKKAKAESILWKTLQKIEVSTSKDPVQVLEEALINVQPSLEVRSLRVAGATYRIPFPIRVQRQRTLGIKWIVDSARKRSEKSMVQRLTQEIMDASKSMGSSVKKRDDVHKQAESNRAFAHYRWF